MDDYCEHFVSEMYLVENDGSAYLPIQIGGSTYNKGVFSPKLVSLPNDKDNFYLYDQLLVGNYPVGNNQVIVSSEFLLVRFYDYSLEKEVNAIRGTEFTELNNLSDFIGESIYMCGETILDTDISVATIDTNCYKFVISGVLNSYYKGINYSGHIFTPNEGFEAYIEDLRGNLGFTRVDEYYDHYINFYLDDIDVGIDLQELSDQIGYEITNDQFREYQETKTLETMLYYMYLAIFFSLIIISGTIDVNIGYSNYLHDWSKSSVSS